MSPASPDSLLPGKLRYSAIGGGVELLSRVLVFATPWTAAHQASLSFLIGYTPIQKKGLFLVLFCF